MSTADRKDTGRRYWRSLNQLADNPEYRKFSDSEFPAEFIEDNNGLSRRHFIGLMGASLALAGLAGCRRPVEKIIPYVNPPEEIIPGVADYYATTMPFDGEAYGLIVKCREGRPIKIEGHPDHPSTRGASSHYMQASILDLYDPDRSSKIMHQGVEKGWDEFVTFWRGLDEKYRGTGGAEIALVAEPVSGPTMARLVEEFRQRFPSARIITPGDKNRFDRSYRTRYRIDRAKVILTMDSDLFLTEPGALLNARGFADGRKPDNDMNRLYAVESGYSLTGAMADHRLRLQSRLIGAFTAALMVQMRRRGLDIDIPNGYAEKIRDYDFDNDWLRAVADDLMAYRGKSLVTAGQLQPPEVRHLAFTINEALGNIGRTVEYFETGETISSGAPADLPRLIENNEIKTVVFVGGNTVYRYGDTFELAIKKAEHSIHFGLYPDETSALTEWHIPLAHYIESWGDARAVDGTVSIIQPLIAPLFDGKAEVEVMNLLATGEDKRGYDIIRDTWRNILPGNFEKEWRQVLHDGLLEGSGRKAVVPGIDNPGMSATIFAAPATADRPEIVFHLSPAVYDGRFANNGWLQEWPDPVTKLAWDNAALISPGTAEHHGLKNGDVIEITMGGNSVVIPAWIQPGLADNSIALSYGYGRTAAGRVGTGVGVNVYPLATPDGVGFGPIDNLRKTGATAELANTQDHNSMEGRPIVRERTLAEYRRNPEFAAATVEHPPLESIFTEHKYDKGYQWGMVVDLNACIGCGACTIACQSENNIPVVGKKQVINGREMHWLRNDRYFTGTTADPQMVIQPVPCQQCENAPCETVCPVAATVHDKEGLNVMTYNRCIGTRYCSNNCPYKVRRFNFFNYTGDMPEVRKMVQNPDVTVRSRGVMEKCTFCIQRIKEATIRAKQEGREVRDGEIKTACQQACPAGAIVFGNINDPESEVSSGRKNDRRYALLAELNVKPRNLYLAKIRNPNPALVKDKPAPEHG